MSSAIEELRRLLDERGADYRVSSTGYSIDIGPYTTAYANRSDTTLDVSLRQVTPEQAINATLGAGECKLEEIDKDCDTASEYMLDREFCFDAVYRCSCGCRFGHVAHDRPRFCPSCGARVVEVTP